MQTPNEKNLQSKLSLPYLNIDLYFYKQIGGTVCYQFFFHNNLVFFSDDYKPLPIHDPFSIPSMISVLSWIAGDSQKQGENHTVEQLDWYDSLERLILHVRATSYDEGTKEVQAAAEAFFKKGFIKYIHPGDVFSLNQVAGNPPDQTVYLTHIQRKNLNTLLNKGHLSEKTQNRIAAAISDNFQKVKKHYRLERIIFNKDEVRFNARHNDIYELRIIVTHITQRY